MRFTSFGRLIHFRNDSVAQGPHVQRLSCGSKVTIRSGIVACDVLKFEMGAKPEDRVSQAFRALFPSHLGEELASFALTGRECGIIIPPLLPDYAMLIRILLITLILTGPLPVRICVCVGATTSNAACASASPYSQVGPVRCSCHREIPEDSHKSPGYSEQQQEAHGSCELHCPSRTTVHDRECPIVKPQQFIADAFVSAPQIEPANDAFLPVAIPGTRLFAPTTSLPSPRFSGRRASLTIPLYIAFLNLRN